MIFLFFLGSLSYNTWSYVILLLVATLTSTMTILTLAIVFPSKLDAFFPWIFFSFLQTWDNPSSYAHLNHICGKHMNYSSNPFEVD
jgi:hypothetical protein